jgi:hypothetical protein
MEYRGFEYKVVQTANPTGWKWVVRLDETRAKVGTTYSRASAMRFAELAIEKHLKKNGAQDSSKGFPMPVRTASE